MSMISGMLARLEKYARRAGAAIRRVRLHLRYPGLEIAKGSLIRKHTLIRATDGGCISIKAGVRIDPFCKITAKYGRMTIGEGSFVGRGSVISTRETLTIGRDALIAEYVTIRDQDHRYGGDRPTAKNGFDTAPIAIGDNVWVGAKATITKGVTIGDNAVIAAGAVVIENVPANTVVGGIPAKVLKQIDG